MIKVRLTSFLLLLGSMVFAQNKVSVVNLRCESMENPIGIEIKTPRFSWLINSTERNSKQLSYRILVSDSPDQLKNDHGNCWDSKEVSSSQSIQNEYAGTKLLAEKKYFWKVRITDLVGRESAWSETSWFTMGLLTSNDWENASWIGFENLPDSMKIFPGIHGFGDKLGNKGIGRSVVPMFRKEFAVTKKIVNATLFISGLGQYEAYINGEKVGKSFLSPGWTDYNKTCFYNVYDVTAQISQGKNALGVIVGNGFYYINRERYRKIVIAYGYPKLIEKLKISYIDGTFSEVVSGTDWKCSPSPISYSSIYGGEDYNATLEQQGWNLPGFDDSKWRNAIQATVPSGKLTAETDYPVTVNQVIPVKKIDQPVPGRYLYDFGQNCSGIIELKVKGKKGSVIQLTPGELITSKKEINQNASGAPYYYTYTLKGDGVEVWRPKFSYYGFRYVMVEGAVPEKEAAKNNLPVIVQLDVLHTCNSSPRRGEFSCSNQLFNQIYTLIDWAIRSNLQSVVTDCPHREKLGWLEQTYLMGASLHYNYDLRSLYTKAVRDMIDAQTPNGLVPDIAPEYVQFEGGFRDSPEWGSAAVLIPWILWEWYGDKSILEEAMPMMQKYVAYLGTRATGNILSHGLGDWFDYGPKRPGEAQLTPKSLTATAIYYDDIQLLSRMMKICNRNADAEKMETLAARVKESFNARFFDFNTMIYSTGSQTSMAMPLCVGLAVEKDRKEVFNNLVKSIAQSGNALTAGDVGFHFLVKALEENGGSQVLYDMNFRNDLPGYGFQLKKGATALTESWPALEEVSNNHLMLGHLMEWFYTGLGGIKQEDQSVAFQHIIIRPEMVGDITHVKTSYLSSFGTIKSEWKRENGILEMKVGIPANSDASVYFPIKEGDQVTENGKRITLVKSSEGKYYCMVGSGDYIFRMND
ncbi:MAG: family 78 glycoside hydrolase catalytic domain [Prolixibacteraceae bacterium]